VDLQNHYQLFVEANTQVMALAVHSLSAAQNIAQVTGATFPVLADPNHVVAEAYGVYNLLGDGIATPAVFIIDKSGRIVWSYIGRDAGDRPTSQTILDNLPSSERSQ
jgi:peroxiredoxin Q/BCP